MTETDRVTPGDRCLTDRRASLAAELTGVRMVSLWSHVRIPVTTRSAVEHEIASQKPAATREKMTETAAAVAEIVKNVSAEGGGGVGGC